MNTIKKRKKKRRAIFTNVDVASVVLPQRWHGAGRQRKTDDNRACTDNFVLSRCLDLIVTQMVILGWLQRHLGCLWGLLGCLGALRDMFASCPIRCQQRCVNFFALTQKLSRDDLLKDAKKKKRAYILVKQRHVPARNELPATSRASIL